MAIVSLRKSRKRSTSGLLGAWIIKFSIPFVIGILVGSFSTLLRPNFKNNNHSFEKEITSSMSDKNSPESSAYVRIQSSPSDTNIGANGWHPIYVYYGKPEALKFSKSPMFQDSNGNEGSQVKQDEILISLIKAHRQMIGNLIGNKNDKPYFVDLAANDASSLSNTYRLERNGWEGLCVEPNPVYWFRLAHRKCAVAGAFVGGKDDMEQVDVFLKSKEFGGIVGEKFDNNEPKQSEKEKRFTISINTMFQQFDVPNTIDYLSLDVEGAEEFIMSDFPFHTYTIRFITIERPKLGLQALLKENKYHFVMQLVSWGETLYVHESVMEEMGMDKINDIVLKNKVQGRKPKKGQQYFDIKSGTYMKQ